MTTMLTISTTPTKAASANADQAAPNAAAPVATASTAAAQNSATAATPSTAGTPKDQPAVQAFAQWLGQQADAAAALQAALAGSDAAKAAPAATPAGQDTPDDEADDAAAADNTQLAAMAMPLLPLPAAQLAQALQAAQGQPADARSSDAASAATSDDTAPAIAATGQDGGRRAAVPPQLAALQAATAKDGATMPATTSAAAQPVTQDAAAAPRVAVQAVQMSAGQADTQDGGGEQPHSQNSTTALANGVVAAAPASQPAADTVKLAGPPTAWRQSLQEALGERLNVQVGKGLEQATIRLDPPQLGRIDIAIRHSGGALEVNITASNGEVLRQLQTVSDNLRSDLSQRQFSEVAVTVAPAPKSGAAPFGDPQQGGRGRQQERDQDESAPGRALAEASTTPSAFSLGGRD
jgi:flagellar hook-length control protein FliK